MVYGTLPLLTPTDAAGAPAGPSGATVTTFLDALINAGIIDAPLFSLDLKNSALNPIRIRTMTWNSS
jgi:hypothetical protein